VSAVPDVPDKVRAVAAALLAQAQMSEDEV